MKRFLGRELAGQLRKPVTRNRLRVPSARTTITSAPIASLAKPENTKGDPGRPTWPSMTASPRAPGDGPPRYQPTFQMLWGVSIAPDLSRPSNSTRALRWMDGISKRAGGAKWTGTTGTGRCRVGRADTNGAVTADA